MTNSASEKVQDALSDAVAQGVFPGVQCTVQIRGEDGWKAQTFTAGSTAWPDSPELTTEIYPVQPSTWFDVASLTKALSTSVLLGVALEAGVLSCDTKLKDYFPELPQADEITVGLLARHRSGLIDHLPFFKDAWTARRAGEEMNPTRFRELIIRGLAGRPLESPVGSQTLYSDPGYILLGWILEAALGDSLSTLFRAKVAGALGCETLAFDVPIVREVALTERGEDGIWLKGRVHDENARELGGVAGHAGLFGTSEGVSALIAHLDDIAEGQIECSSAILRQSTVQRLWEPYLGERFTLGWDTPSEPSSSGRYTTRGHSVGHLGFTGCSVWHDRVRKVTITLLSNRVHPTRENWKIKHFRPVFHDLVNSSFVPSFDR
ncbi:MAG: beta-lactamase family protein [Myxococcales bacterium]|nr:beta-lactamase family protein [Myxococcales bacterium]